MLPIIFRLLKAPVILASLVVFCTSAPLAATPEPPSIFVQLGHASMVTSLAVSPDGHTLAAADFSGSVLLWDVDSGKEIGVFPARDFPVMALAFSPNGKRLYGAVITGSVIEYDLDKVEIVREVRVQPGRTDLIGLAVSPDGKLLAVGGLEGVIRVFDSATLSLVATLDAQKSPVSALAFTPDSRRLLSAGELKVRLWDLSSQQLLASVDFQNKVTAMSLSPDGKTLAVTHDPSLPTPAPMFLADMNRGVSLIDMATFKVLPGISGFDGVAGAVSWSPDGHQLAASVISKHGFLGKADVKTLVWDIPFSSQPRALPNPQTGVSSLVWLPNGKTVVTGSWDYSVRLQAISGRSEQTLIGNTLEPVEIHSFTSEKHGGFVTVSSQGDVSFWDTKSGRLETRQEAPPLEKNVMRQVLDSKVTPQGVLMIASKNQVEGELSRPDENGVRLVQAIVPKQDWASDDVLKRLNQLPGVNKDNRIFIPFLNRARFIKNGLGALLGVKFMATGNLYRFISRVVEWDVGSEAGYTPLPFDVAGEITALNQSNDNQWLMLATEEKIQDAYNSPKKFELQLRRRETGALVWSANLYQQQINNIQFSPDSRYALVTSGFMLELIDLSKGEVVLRGFHDKSISAAAFSTDGKRIYSGGWDDRIGVWDVEKKTHLGWLQGHQSAISGIAGSEDGRFLYSTSMDRTVRVWDLKNMIPLTVSVDFTHGDWVTVAPEGYFQGSSRGIEQIGFRVGQKLYPLDYFYDLYYRPDLIQRKLQGKALVDEVPQNVASVLSMPPPGVSVIPLAEQQGKLKFRVDTQSLGGGVGEVRAYLNGKLVVGGNNAGSKHASAETATANKSGRLATRSVDASNASRDRTPLQDSTPQSNEYEISLAPGDNEITVFAFNQSNTVQGRPQSLSVRSSAQQHPPRIFLLAIGINHFKGKGGNDLQWAAKDAKDVSDFLSAHKSQLLLGDLQPARVLTDNEATRERILAEFSHIAQEARPEDSLVVFVASHGVFEKNTYSILTHDFDGDLTWKNSLSAKDIVDAGRKIAAQRQILILDTCHAGGMNESLFGLYDSRVTLLARNIGLHVIASASTLEKALDGLDQNGFFTHFLLKGLQSSEPDVNQDKAITTQELGKYTTRQVIKESDAYGMTQTPVSLKVGTDLPLISVPTH